MIDGDQVYGKRLPGVPPGKAAQRAALLYWSLPTPRPNLDQALPAGPGDEVLAVYANHGRWVVSCPTCNGSQFASRTDPRFFCADCGNIAVEGRWRRIQWPTQWRNIEAELNIRRVENQNWWPTETVNDLREENERHRLVIPKPGRVAPASTAPADPRTLGIAREGNAAGGVTRGLDHA